MATLTGNQSEGNEPVKVTVPEGLPFDSFPCKDAEGEWVVPMPEDYVPPHATNGWPTVRFETVDDQRKMVCILRWGKGRLRHGIESDARDDLLAALNNAMQKAEAIPVIRHENWTARLQDNLGIAVGSVRLTNTAPLGLPSYMFDLPGHNIYKKLIEGPCMPTVEEAFQSLVQYLKQLPVPEPEKVSATGKADLEALTQSRVTLHTVRSKEGLVAIRAQWYDIGGSSIVNESGMHASLSSAFDELREMIAQAQKVGPRVPGPILYAALLGIPHRNLKVDFFQVASDETLVACLISVNEKLSVRSSACKDKKLAFLSAVDRLKHALNKNTSADRPTVVSGQALVELAKQRWLKERAYLQQNENKDIKESDRIHKLSLFLALLDPLRKYELEPFARKSLLPLMAGELTKLTNESSIAGQEALRKEYLLALTKNTPIDPGEPLHINQGFKRKVALSGDTEQRVIEALVAGRWVRRSIKGELSLGQKGVDVLRAKADEASCKKTLGDVLPEEVRLALSSLAMTGP